MSTTALEATSHALPDVAVSPRINLCTSPLDEVLQSPDTLAAICFSNHVATTDPRVITVPLPTAEHSRMPIEYWRTREKVTHGKQGEVRFSRGGPWLFAAIEVKEHDFNNLEQASAFAYHHLCQFLSSQPDTVHVQRIWNYLDAINQGAGDQERYKHFCAGRHQGMHGFFAKGYPAATAIGYPVPTGKLTLYCLATYRQGTHIENPRQMSAWEYPRQYGRLSPLFARATRLPDAQALAISGTAAITGHRSLHHDDIISQLDEIRTNMDALINRANMPTSLNTEHNFFKVYVRHQKDMTTVANYLDRHLPKTKIVLLQGDVCRRELLVEAEAWLHPQAQTRPQQAD